MDGSGIQCQRLTGLALEVAVEAAQKMRHHIPQGLFDHRKPPAGLVLGRRAPTPDLVGFPGGGNLAFERLVDLLDFFGRGIEPIPLAQQLGDVVVLL